MTAGTAAATRTETIPPLAHRRWMKVGKAENEAFIALLRDLSSDEWSLRTECPRWTVKDVASHVLGAAEGFTSFRELRRQMTGAKERAAELGNQLNAMNEIQVEDRRALAPEHLIERLEDVLPRFLRLRNRLGGIGRVLPLYDKSVLGLTNTRYLFDTIFARDVFMHRFDISRAVGRR